VMRWGRSGAHPWTVRGLPAAQRSRDRATKLIAQWPVREYIPTPTDRHRVLSPSGPGVRGGEHLKEPLSSADRAPTIKQARLEEGTAVPQISMAACRCSTTTSQRNT
jgi:hypothetical protein